jgi:hypothetical protein
MSGVQITLEERGALALVRKMAAISARADAALRAGRTAQALALLETLKAATPYRPEDTEEGQSPEGHARDGWTLQEGLNETAIENLVPHLWYLLHGNHPNSPDGLIHPTQASVLHFYDGGTEVFAHGVQPMDADPELVAAVDAAEHSAEALSHSVRARLAAALHGV